MIVFKGVGSRRETWPQMDFGKVAAAGHSVVVVTVVNAAERPRSPATVAATTTAVQTVSAGSDVEQ